MSEQFKEKQTEEYNPVNNPLTYKTPGELQREEDENIDEKDENLEGGK